MPTNLTSEAKRMMDFAILKEFMVALFGSERGKQDEVGHLMHMASSCLTEWQDETKRLKNLFREIEWQAHGHFCYVCVRAKCDGHSPECSIGKALAPKLPFWKKLPPLQS
jgi:hypothetical protein